MEDIAGWIAPIATMIAAMMTAANIGPRVTGWGFVLFTIGSIAWIIVAVATGQANLLWTNGFLCVVNGVGIWRWLGREAKLGDGARHATSCGEAGLFPLADLVGKPLFGPAGVTVGHSVGAMVECEGGRLSYIVAREGGVAGVGERLHAIRWADVDIGDDGLVVPFEADDLALLPTIAADAWPAEPPAALERA